MIKLIEKVSENEVVAEFLLAEINSPRFSEGLVNALDGKSKSVLTNPDLNNECDNKFRKKLLGVGRGFGLDKALFEGFPKDVEWHKAIIEKEELIKIKYINYGFWNKLTSKTRSSKKAIQNIKSGIKFSGIDFVNFNEVGEKVRDNGSFPRIIVVSRFEKTPLIVLEGHTRLTAYLLNIEHVPQCLEIFVGFSRKLNRWKYF